MVDLRAFLTGKVTIRFARQDVTDQALRHPPTAPAGTVAV
jgi:hypothetical protein